LPAHAAAIGPVVLPAGAPGSDVRGPLATSAPLAGAHARIRAAARFGDRDRAFAPDLEAVRSQVERGDYVDDVPEALCAD
jgi:histidine ammonia-lyase